jgi:hypothetical protein
MIRAPRLLLHFLGAVVIVTQAAAEIVPNISESGVVTTPYAAWANWPSNNPNYFPIGVWLQSSHHIAEFREIGINLFVGTSDFVDETTLKAFEHAAMPLIAEQGPIALTSPYRSAIAGWMQPDEPDNAQPNGLGGYGTCIEPSKIVADYTKLKSADSSRPVLLGFGRGVADTQWSGRGGCTGQTTTYYPVAVRGGDIIAFDIYPVASYQGRLEFVARGLDNLRAWIAMAGQRRIIWNAIEAVPIHSGAVPTATQERAEIWMSIIHGSRGIVYFVHQFNADEGRLIREDGIFNFPTLANAVRAINAEVTSLAPVLNSPDVVLDGVSLEPKAEAVDTMVRRYQGAIYLFAICMRATCGTTRFTLSGISYATVEVIGESRILSLADSVFQDEFAGYDVHLYRIIAR